MAYSLAFLHGGSAAQQIDHVAQTNNSVQTVSPDYFVIRPDGSMSLQGVSKQFVEAMHAQGIRVVPYITNNWDRNAGILALQNAETLSDQVANALEEFDLDGVIVDIENATDTQRSQNTQLVRLLRGKIPADKEVSIAVGANPDDVQTGWLGSYDYAALGDISDYLVLMAYDEHYMGSPAGPVASIGFVEQSIQYALSKVPGNKIMLGSPFYGRIWSLNDDATFKGDGISLRTIDKLLNTYSSTVTFDEESQSPKALLEVTGDQPTVVNGKTLSPGKYEIWFENEQSIKAKLKLVKKYGLKGAAAWSLGQELPSIWQNYSSWLNGNDV